MGGGVPIVLILFFLRIFLVFCQTVTDSLIISTARYATPYRIRKMCLILLFFDWNRFLYLVQSLSFSWDLTGYLQSCSWPHLTTEMSVNCQAVGGVWGGRWHCIQCTPGSGQPHHGAPHHSRPRTQHPASIVLQCQCHADCRTSNIPSGPWPQSVTSVCC